MNEELLLGIIGLISTYNLYLNKKTDRAISRLFELDREQTKDIASLKTKITSIEKSLNTN